MEICNAWFYDCEEHTHYHDSMSSHQRRASQRHRDVKTVKVEVKQREECARTQVKGDSNENKE